MAETNFKCQSKTPKYISSFKIYDTCKWRKQTQQRGKVKWMTAMIVNVVVEEEKKTSKEHGRKYS